MGTLVKNELFKLRKKKQYMDYDFVDVCYYAFRPNPDYIIRF